MNTTPLLQRACDELRAVHGAHTLLLYGSRADGSQNEGSDYDIAAYAPIAAPARDARWVDGEFLDIFIYPEAALATPTADDLKLRGSRVLLQRGDEATVFLAALDALYAAGPTPLPADELAARRAWAWKMVARMARGDAEGHYRRAWLLMALLEDYFHLRGQWYAGPKKALQGLKRADAAAHAAFEAALQPGAPDAAICALVERVVGPGPGSGGRGHAS